MPTSRDILSELIVEKLAVHPSLAALEGRVWHGELSTLPDPTFPLLTFHRDGGVQDPFGPMSNIDLVVVSHSTQGQDEAWAIYAAARVLLDHEYFARDEMAFRLQLTVGPIPDPLRAPTPLYRVIALYKVHAVGA